LPDLDGWTVLAAIKGDPALASIPVVLMSIVEEKNRGYALGAADYLVKPVDRTKLGETLTSICGSTTGRALLVDDDDVVRRGVRQALSTVTPDEKKPHVRTGAFKEEERLKIRQPHKSTRRNGFGAIPSVSGRAFQGSAA
jgi:DNA-binding NarL/FixJ family response regulator